MALSATPPEPYDEGMLDVGDGNQVYWQVRGTPGGKPAVVVHGGPGGGFHRGGYRRFDREGYQLVMFDQRCGNSTPHASDPATDMRHNTAAAAGITEVLALTDLDNLPSQAVATRLGMRDEGTTDRWFGLTTRQFRKDLTQADSQHP